MLNLGELVNCIRESGAVDEKKRHEMVHKFYGFTDALIIDAMRQLHDELDKTVGTKADCGQLLSQEEEKQKYINDCIKMVMDGEIPEPVETCQRLATVVKDVKESYASEMEQEAKGIAQQVASELKVSELRIKADVRTLKVMKYTKLMGEAEGANREAVRTFYEEDETSVDQFAAESNASILGGLIDRELVIFNLYYIGFRNEQRDSENQQAIRKAFSDFIRKHFHTSAMGCGCPDGLHICQMMGETEGLETAKQLVQNPQFMCRKCLRVAAAKENLCAPVEIGG
jgi:hypothetical protein